MAVVREQFAVESELVAAHGDGTDEVYNIVKPALPLEGNTIDFVARPSTRREFFQGKAFLEANAALSAAGIALRKIEILDLKGNLARTVLDVDDNAYDLTLDVAKDLLKSMLLREDEQTIAITIRNDSGGAVAGQVLGRFDLGLNTVNYGSLPLNI